MKKLFLISMLALISMMGVAQNFTFGPMVGGGFSLASNDYTNATVKPNGSFMGGAFARIGIKKFYIEPEIYYINKTSNFTSSSLLGDSKTTLKTGNVNVNLLLGFKVVNLKVANVRVFAGPTMSFVAAKSFVNDFNGFKTTYNPNNVSNTSFNLHAGLGIDITKLAIDVRYERGLTNMDATGTNQINFNNLLVTLGFKIL